MIENIQQGPDMHDGTNLGNILAGRIILNASKSCENGGVSPEPSHATRHLLKNTTYNLHPNRVFDLFIF
jgi:hypothetical protein